MSVYLIDFNRNYGGIESVEGFEYGVYEVGLRPDGQRRYQKMLILNNFTSDGNVSRFSTQRFDMEGKRHAILVMEYFMDGEAATSISIIQQDRFKEEIWMSSAKSNQWQKARVVLSEVREPAFEILAHCLPDRIGTIAVSKIAFKLCQCCNGCTVSS